VARWLGPGRALVLGVAICSSGWLVLALAPAGTLGVAAFAIMLTCYGTGATLIFINFLALRQSVTPAPILGRMTSTMRWLILLPGVPGALIGGWLGEHLGLQTALGFAGGLGLLLAVVAIRLPVLRDMRSLPEQVREAAPPGTCAAAGPPAVAN